MIPAGATATVEITELSRSENANDKINMGFRVVSVSFGGKTYPVSATTTYANIDRVKNQPKDKDVQKVVGGAVVGAVLGRVLGGSTKSTVIGAAAGAAAGTGAAAATANYEGCVPDGGRITITLDSSTQVQA
jgi:outer membrane lipoprotein SlyB